MNTPKLTIDTPIEIINQFAKNTLVENLGIKFTAIATGMVEAEMPIDNRTMRPGGYLHGGANLAFAETIAGLGSMILVDIDEFDVRGIQISANHIATATEGKVFGRAEIIHPGKQTQVWNVEIKDLSGKLISTCRVTNMIVKRNGK